MTGEKLCLRPEHMSTHRDNATHCTMCAGRILRFRGDDPGLDIPPELAPAPAPWVVVSRVLLWALIDAEPCIFDHHGGCQAHGHLDLEPGDICPHEEAKQLLERPAQ